MNSTYGIVVAVLPFQTLSRSEPVAFYATGFVNDLVTDLARFNTIQIISLSSTKALGTDSSFDDEIIRALKADYLVKGSFRCLDNNLRINIQLINADNGSIIWAEKFDEELSLLLAVQDEIIQQIVSILQQQINTNLLASSRKEKTTNLKAYECWLRGMEQLEQGTLESDLEARKYFEQALIAEPGYARAYTGLSLSYFNEWSCQLWERWDASQQGAYKYAQKAVELDSSDPVSLTVIGRIHLYKGDYEIGEQYLRRSLKLNPNDAGNLAQLAVCFVYLGYLKEAEKLYQRSMALNPLNETSYYGAGALIYFELGQYEKAIDLGLKANFDKVWVDLPALIAGAYFKLGDMLKTAEYWAVYENNFSDRIAKKRELAPNEALQWFINVNPYKGQSNIIPLLEHFKNDGPAFGNRLKKNEILMPVVNEFKKGTGLWEISYGGHSVILPDAKGYHDIKNLLGNANKQLHCTELMGTILVQQGDDELALDEKAKLAYKKRMQSLLHDIEEAEDLNDSRRALEARLEYEQLVQYLSGALGLNNKARKLNSSVERTRSAVTWRIRSAIKKIETAHPQLAKHFSNTIQTGTFCTYAPESAVQWEL